MEKRGRTLMPFVYRSVGAFKALLRRSRLALLLVLVLLSKIVK